MTDYSKWDKAVDLSLYQPKFTGLVLRSAGVKLVIAKCSSGMNKDPLFDKHLAETIAAGMIFSAYHWCDPIINPEKQAQFFLDCIKDKPVAAIFLDVEQWWTNWGTWYQAVQQKIAWTAVKIFRPKDISENARRIAEYIRARVKIPVVIYTSRGFVLEHAPDMATWMKDYLMWLAEYVFIGKRVSLKWSDFDAVIGSVIRSYTPTLPPGSGRLVGWQFSGDKFLLPGVYAEADGSRESALDLNLFDPEFIKSIAAGVPMVEPMPEPEPVAQAVELYGTVVTVPYLNVRSDPRVGNNDVGDLATGQRVPILGIAGPDLWLKISENPERWVCARQAGRTLVEIGRK